MFRAYRFSMKCPRCYKKSTVTLTQEEPPVAPDVSCGDCLMNNVEVVKVQCIKVETL